MRGDDLPRRIDDQPANGSSGERPEQDGPAIVSDDQVLSEDVVERECHGRQERGDDSARVEVHVMRGDGEPRKMHTADDDSDGKHAAENGQQNSE